MIKLGLERAARLFAPNPQPWQAIHVAGTNGKGSVCIFITNALRSQRIRCGTFTSPHLVNRWDCIRIDGKPVARSKFLRNLDYLRQRNMDEEINASEFELLTATAFQIFTDELVDVGIVETGMGGRLDATNVLKHKDLAVITKIGMDHEEFLGHNLRDITAEKCGIFKENVEVIYDGKNHPEVLSEIRHQSWAHNTLPLRSNYYEHDKWTKTHKKDLALVENHIGDSGLDSYLHHNAFVAYQAALSFMRKLGIQGRQEQVQMELSRAISLTKIPARMQKVGLKSIVKQLKHICIDGAHNPQAIHQLKLSRQSSLVQNTTWLLGFSEGKSLDEMILPLLKDGDHVAALAFGPVSGMEWKQPIPSLEIKNFIESQKHINASVKDFGRDILAAIHWAATHPHPIYVAGSLYLASDVLRLLKDYIPDLLIWDRPYYSGSHSINLSEDVSDAMELQLYYKNAD